jgi:hypothetical protein
MVLTVGSTLVARRLLIGTAEDGLASIQDRIDKAAEFRSEQCRVMRDIETHQNANKSYNEEGIRLLELAQRAHLLFENQPPAEKRKLLDFVLSNCRWKDGKLQAEYRKPFDMLAVTVAAGPRAKAEPTQETGKNENWLARLDSNRSLRRRA